MAKLDKKSSKTIKLGYDAADSKNRRTAPRTSLNAEHVILPDSKRRKLMATVQDQVRNISTMAWMVRRHLDYVSRFRFQFRTGKPALDSAVNRLFDWHARPQNFDIAGRLGREEMFRMFELEKVTSGDAALVKLDGLKLQAVESDLIAYPTTGSRGAKRGEYTNLPPNVAESVDKDCGVILSNRYPGKVDFYSICNRGWDGNVKAFDHLEDAANVIFDAYYTRFSSQIRGVSPLSTAINAIQDLYEGMEWNLLKAKIHAFFGVAVMRDYYGAESDQEEVSQLGAASGINTGYDEAVTGASSTTAGTKTISSSLQELKPNQMLMVDMDTKGRIDTIESKTPSAEFQAYTELMMRVSMLALDIPYTAFNSAQASFSGIIADQNLYDVSCRWKREKNKWARENYSEWLIRQAWDSPDWNLRSIASANGITSIRDVIESVEWMAAGAPWLQKLQEVQGDKQAIALGLDNPIDAAKRRGSDFYENISKTAAAYQFARDNNVPLVIGDPGQATTQDAPVDPTTGTNP